MIAASEGLDADALTFAFRPLWQLDAASAATVALQKAQATQIYAGLNLWPAATTARLVGAQLAADGTYPNASAVFGEGEAVPSAAPTLDDAPDQPRDWHGRWTAGGESGVEAAPETPVSGMSSAPPPAEISVPRGATAVTGPAAIPAASSPETNPVGASPDRGEAKLLTVSDPLESGEQSAVPLLPSAQIDEEAQTAAVWLAAALVFLYGASRSAIQELFKHLPSWPHSEPKTPGPNGSGPPPSKAPQDPRPLTIDPKGSSGPPPAVQGSPSSPSGSSPAPTGEFNAPIFNKPPQDAYDPNGPKAPGKPPPETGFRDPKGGERWVRNPNGRGYGWEDRDGDVWVPTGQGGDAHGGPHWDVQGPGGRYRNERPHRND